MSSDSNSIVRNILTGSAWSFIGVLLAMSFFYWQEYRNPYDFNIELVDEFNLVEVREKISDLKIIYKNDDIIESKKEIKVVRIALRNDGDTILQSYYDQLEPFGLRFSNAKILNAEVITTNSDHLKDKLIKSFSDGESEQYDDLIFEKVIFDEKDTATIKITLLQTSGASLSITALGKLANISELKVHMATQDDSDPVSTEVYIVGGYFGFVIFLFSIIGVITVIENLSKKNKVRKYRKKHDQLTDSQEKIVALYFDLMPSTERLISGLLKNDYALDFNEVINHQKPKTSGLTKIFLLPLLITNRMRYKTLPKEIFSVDGTTVGFNEENKDFIVSFFGEVL